MSTRVREIANALRKALLKDGDMELSLYKFKLEEHVDEWYEGLKDDYESFVFVVTEDSGNVAMILISQNKTVYVNEEARAKLSELWIKNYIKNIKFLISRMADDIDYASISIIGCVISKKSNRQKAIGMGRKISK